MFQGAAVCAVHKQLHSTGDNQMHSVSYLHSSASFVQGYSGSCCIEVQIILATLLDTRDFRPQ